MQDGFDPYHKWLGIPPQEQPPHYYRLLALPLFESDLEVIESAADQRMGHVRTFQRGRHSVLSQQILNELAAARVCLLSREKKSAYDAELQSQLAPAPPQSPTSSILPSPPPPILAPLAQQSIAGTAHSAIAPPPAGGLLGQPARVFPPLDGALPDPATPVPTVTPTMPARRSKNYSVLAGVLGGILLLFASGLFWILYQDQQARDSAASLQEPDLGVSQPVSGPDDPTPQEAGEDVLAGEPSDQGMPSEATPNTPETVDSETAGTTVAKPGAMEPPTDDGGEPAPLSTDRLEGADPSEPPASPTGSLADLLETDTGSSASAADDSEDMPNGAETQAGGATPDDTVEKWRVPRRVVLDRKINELQPLIVPATFGSLLVEAQNADRPSTEVYAILLAARLKAIMANDADGALQVVDMIERQFYGNYDSERVDSLRGIGRRMTTRRQFQDLASVAMRASQEADGNENRSLALSLANVALEAAERSGDTTLQQRITTYLDQLR